VGEPIWNVDSPVHLLEALGGCIKGHQALLNAGYLHRDISINNLLLDKQTDDPDRKSFLIDLDVAVSYPVANDKDGHTRTGTKVFMSSGLLLNGGPHSFVDDLESFFWVFIWICIYYPENRAKQTPVSDWNQKPLLVLALLKQYFLRNPNLLTSAFTPQYIQFKPLIQCVEEFAKIMSNDLIRSRPSEELYRDILALFRKAQES